MTAMTNDLLTALAREFAEETKNGILGLFPQPLPDSMEVLIKNDQEYYGRFLRWLTRRYCLVEKSKVKDIHKGILVQIAPKNFGYSPYNQGRIDLLKSLFPEIGKEVEK